MCDTPAVEHPFEGDFEMRDGHVSVHGDDEVVMRNELVEDVRHNPRIVVVWD